jgi:hypothetical protein
MSENTLTDWHEEENAAKASWLDRAVQAMEKSNLDGFLQVQRYDIRYVLMQLERDTRAGNLHRLRPSVIHEQMRNLYLDDVVQSLSQESPTALQDAYLLRHLAYRHSSDQDYRRAVTALKAARNRLIRYIYLQSKKRSVPMEALTFLQQIEEEILHAQHSLSVAQRRNKQ